MPDVEQYIRESYIWISNPLNIFIVLTIATVLAIIFFKLQRSLSKPFNKIVLGKGKLDLSHSNLVNHLFLLACSSAGKTKSIIEPLIANMFKQKITGLIYDYKWPDVASFHYSISLKDESDVNNWYLNFHDPSRSHRINPLAQIESTAEAVELAETLVRNFNHGEKENTFWSKSGIAILSAAIFTLSRYENGKYSSLPHVIELIVSKSPKELIDILSSNREAGKILSPISTGKDAIEQLSGQVSTIQADLSRYVNENIYWVLSANSPDFDSLALNDKMKPARLVVGNDPENPTYASPLVGLIFSAALRKMTKAGRLPSILLADEAGTFCVQGLESRIATVRSYGISVCLAAQDYSQLEKIYGVKQAQEIRGSSNTKGYGKLSEGLDYVQKHFGTYTVKQKTTSVNHNGMNSSSGTSFSDREEPRVKTEYVSALSPGEFLFDSNGKRFKQKVKLKNYDRYPLPKFTYVTPQLLASNYARIEKEIESIRA